MPSQNRARLVKSMNDVSVLRINAIEMSENRNSIPSNLLRINQ